MPIYDERGRIVTGPDIDHRDDETGRIMIRRPLTEMGRRIFGDFYLIVTETMDTPMIIDFDPSIEIESTVCAQNWDLKKMMPAKFQAAPVMTDYLDAISQVVNAISCRIDALAPLIDVENCPRRFLGHLASLIGYKLKNQTLASTEDLRRQINMAVEMYKIKGTYDVLSIAFYIIGLEIQIWDLWTMDYQTFTRRVPHYHSGVVPGFNPGAGLVMDDGHHFDENMNTDGGGGFKSPHFDLVINMNRIMLQQGVYQKLFIASMWQSILDVLEEFTPVNTVPHIYLALYALCKEDLLPYTISTSQVKTCLTTSWNMQTLFMDQSPALHMDQPAPNEIFMDQDDNVKLEDITVFKIGTGNKGLTPSSSVTDLAAIVYTGTVTSFQVTNEKITFNMTVPAGVTLSDISELGLYHAGSGNLMVVSFFPPYDKPSAAVNEIMVEVLRKK